MYKTTIIYALISSYSILVLIRNFPKDQEMQQSPQNLFYITAVALLIDFAN